MTDQLTPQPAPPQGKLARLLHRLGRPIRHLSRSNPAPFFIVCGGLLVIALLVAFVPKRDESRPATPPPPLPVSVIELESIEVFRDTFRQTGAVTPNRTVTLAAEVAARVDRYAGRDDRVVDDGRLKPGRASTGPVAEGDTVRKNQPLLQLNTDLLIAERNRARAQYEYQKRELARIKELFEQNVATASEVDTVRSAYDVAQAALNLAEANLERAVIVSPIDGVLNDILVEVGEYVTPGTPVARVVEMDPAVVVFDIPEKDIGFLAVGEEVTISHGLVDETTLDGRISYISELADEASRTTRVEVEVPNPTGPDGKRRLRDGQIVDGTLTRRVLRDVLLIPMAAIIPLEHGKVAYIVEEGKAQRKDITLDLNLKDGQHICVTEGLKPGQQLIVKGLGLVGPGQPVQIETTGGLPELPARPATAPASQPTTAPASEN